MKKKIIIAVVAGYAVWTVLWLVGGQVLGAEATRETGPLVMVLALSIVCSLAAGFTAAKMSGVFAALAVKICAIALLITGIGVQAGVWSQMPTWYHLVFLALIFPVTQAGGRLVKR